MIGRAGLFCDYRTASESTGFGAPCRAIPRTMNSNRRDSLPSRPDLECLLDGRHIRPARGDLRLGLRLLRFGGRFFGWRARRRRALSACRPHRSSVTDNGGLDIAVALGRDLWGCAPGETLSAYVVAVVAFVGERGLGISVTFGHQVVEGGAVMGLAGREDQRDWKTLSVGPGMDFGRKASVRAAKSLVLSSPLRRRHGGVPGWMCCRPSASRRCHRRRPALQASGPTAHWRSNGGFADARSSNCRVHWEGLAKALQCARSRRWRPACAGGRAAAGPAADRSQGRKE